MKTTTCPAPTNAASCIAYAAYLAKETGSEWIPIRVQPRAGSDANPYTACRPTELSGFIAGGARRLRA